MSKGKHRAPVIHPNYGRIAVVGAVGVGTGLSTVPMAAILNPTPAQATTVTDPQLVQRALGVIADCESGARVPGGAIPGSARNVENAGPSTASGFLQFIDGTWRGLGGTQYAPRAIGATRDQQFEVGARAVANRGGSFADWNASRSCWDDDVAAILAGRAGAAPAAQLPPVPPPVVRQTARPEVPRLPHGNKNGVVECRDFIDQAEVQAFLNADPSDPFNVDQDNDGQACEVFFAGGRHRAPEPPAAVAPSGAVASPLPGALITTRFSGGHPGIDLDGVLGQAAFAAADVTITEARTSAGYGRIVVGRANIDGQVVDFQYAHMNGLQVTPGQTIRAGQQIVQVGNSGTVRAGRGGDGSHLHFEVWIGGYRTGRAVDPVQWLAQHGVRV